MLKLIRIEWKKMRRRKEIWLMLPSSLIMPVLTVLYFHALGRTEVEPLLFYRWSAFGFNLFVILPLVLGLLCIWLTHDERKWGVERQLFLVPVSSTAYFFSKFFVVFLYALAFMLLTAAASLISSVCSGLTAFQLPAALFLVERCLELALLVSLASLPVLALAVAAKSYFLPVCALLLFLFFGFFLAGLPSCVHPLSAASIWITRNGEIPGITYTESFSAPAALLSIGIWSMLAVFAGILSLKKRRR